MSLQGFRRSEFYVEAAKGRHLADQLAEEKRKLDECMKQARTRIQNAIDQDGQFTHNMISISLREVSNKFGYRYANELVREFDLAELYEINEIEEEHA